MAELLYGEEPVGVLCKSCGHAWRPSALGGGDACPACGSADLGTAFRQIPELSPELSVIVWAEGSIPRAENGAILHRDMLSFLRLHGVRDRSEQILWAEWFDFVGQVRARLTEEARAPKEPEGGREREEE